MTQSPLDLLEARRMEAGPQDQAQGDFKHWRVSREQDNIVWALFDRAAESANTLSEETLKELDAICAALEDDPPKGLVIRSAKASGFIAGADIRDFKAAQSEEEVFHQIKEANDIVDRLAALDFPTVALVHGYCLGGGLEIALACDIRIAIDGATFGFPEVKLGLHPGLGGTVRLTRLIDPAEAMTIMLAGKTVHTKKAEKLGIVDAVTQERHAASAVRAAVRGDIEKSNHGMKDAAMNTGPGRTIAARQMQSETESRAPKAHYPAPYALIDLWEQHGGDPSDMKEAEISSFSKLMLTETTQNLIRVYFLREQLKDRAGKKDDTIRHVHVIGAGAMGGDIAGWCAVNGLRTTLSDVETAPVAEAVKRAAKLCEDKHLSGIETRDALDRLIPDIRGKGAARADLVIEAAPEKKELKGRIYGDVEPRLKDSAMVATNTSSIPLGDLAQALDDPARFVGLHFFNPVSRMEVVEVVRHDGVADDVFAAAVSFVGRIDKLPVPVDSAPGFLVNRTLMPYLMEALVMLDEGAEKETIDRAAKQFGMPMGPIELADQVGLDICLDVAEMLLEGLDEPMADIPDWLREKVEAGDLGRKTGKGLYEWKDGEAQMASDPDEPTDDMADRLILPMINACAACLRKGVVDSVDTLDGAMIFATGFAPFRGGPMHYAKARGHEVIHDTLAALAQTHGERFAPDPFWRE